MRRWNGWGEEKIHLHLPQSAGIFLEAAMGRGLSSPDISFEDVTALVPPTRLPDHPYISIDAADRVRHARGQSLPDWIALRSGHINVFPDGVAYPKSDEEVRQLLTLGSQIGAQIIPYGGGTSVVGHINPMPGDQPVLTIDMGHLNNLVDLDETSHLATFGAGVRGPALEKDLQAKGYTLGHFPQSFEYSTLGGWIATRSSGQQSVYYGRIESIFAGGGVETPTGRMEIKPNPASAAGPDLRQIILGSEGRLGVITRAVVRIRPLPEVEGFYAIFFRDWLTGIEAVRTIIQDSIPVSMLRLSDARETETTLKLAGRERLLAWADRALSTIGYRDGRCLMIFGVTGKRRGTAFARRRVKSISGQYGGLSTGRFIGNQWRKSRFRSAYLRNSLWDNGYALDTLETAVRWSAVRPMAAGLIAAIEKASKGLDKPVLAFAHLSHVYNDGASIYVTYLFPRSGTPEETLQHWQVMKDRASQFIIHKGGTISHQHGVGLDHAPYMKDEKSETGLSVLEAVRGAVDPEEIMNPGKLLPKTVL